MMRSDAERIAALEAEQRQTREEMKALVDEVKAVNGKIDILVALKERGMGAMWFAGLVIASGIIGWVVTLFHWVVGDK